MHELGILIEIVKSVESIAIKNGVTKVDTLVLQVGELATVVPSYLEECYPAAIDGTSLQETKLKIEILPGNAMCKDCNNVFNLIVNNGTCPKCESKNFEIISGKEFMIKEIVAC